MSVNVAMRCVTLLAALPLSTEAWVLGDRRGAGEDDFAKAWYMTERTDDQIEDRESLNGSQGSKQLPYQDPWYIQVASPHFPHYYSLDLEGHKIRQAINASGARYALIEYYYPWCPHCQHFAPEFERLSFSLRSISVGSLSPGEPTVLTGTVDCVRYEEYCLQQGITAAPRLRFGPREAWLDPHIRSQFVVDVNVRELTAESVAGWINARVNVGVDPSHISRTEFLENLPSQSIQNEAPMLTPTAVTADSWDAQVAAALLIHYAMTKPIPYSAVGEVQIEAFISLLGVLSRRLPDSTQGSCRASLESLQQRFQEDLIDRVREGRDHYGQSADYHILRINADNVEAGWQLCGTPWADYNRSWGACRGTWPGKRGYTCGLWTLFHYIAARAEDDTALEDLLNVRKAIQHFYQCEECRLHFLQIPQPQGTITRQDAQLWWWNAHNIVNQRVRRLEEMFGDGDPRWPKVQWPSNTVCPSCQPQGGLRRKSPKGLRVGDVQNGGPPLRIGDDVPVADMTLEERESEGWNLDEVVKFLSRFYE